MQHKCALGQGMIDGGRRVIEVPLFDIRAGYLYLVGVAGAPRAEAIDTGAIAQLGERYNGIVEVKGSSPFSSTRVGVLTAGWCKTLRAVRVGWRDLTGRKPVC